MADDVDQVDDGAAEEPDRGAAIAAWKKRDRAAELAELADDADAVAGMRKRLARLGVKAARNPFGPAPEPSPSSGPVPGTFYDWQRFIPRPKTKG